MTATQEKTIAEVVALYLANRAEQKRLEQQARKFAKEANILESALARATDEAGGTIEVGEHMLGFEWKAGTPSYKTICEEIVAENNLSPALILQKVGQTPPKRVFVIA